MSHIVWSLTVSSGFGRTNARWRQNPIRFEAGQDQGSVRFTTLSYVVPCIPVPAVVLILTFFEGQNSLCSLRANSGHFCGAQLC
eukprot:scaffold945_cov103-Skeletonema_dohrnii-CCMP3373.AAC.6